MADGNFLINDTVRKVVLAAGHRADEYSDGVCFGEGREVLRQAYGRCVTGKRDLVRVHWEVVRHWVLYFRNHGYVEVLRLETRVPGRE